MIHASAQSRLSEHGAVPVPALLRIVLISDMVGAVLSLLGTLGLAAFYFKLRLADSVMATYGPWRIGLSSAAAILFVVSDFMLLGGRARALYFVWWGLVPLSGALILELAQASLTPVSPNLQINLFTAAVVDVSWRVLWNASFIIIVSWFIRRQQDSLQSEMPSTATFFASAPRVFISYRRKDAGPYAGWIAEGLSKRFGKDRVFTDVHGLRPGRDFSKQISDEIQRSDALLVLITHDWIAVRDERGQPRLEDPQDFVRREVATALGEGVLTIPVLLDGAPPPAKGSLPQELAELADRQAVRMSYASFTDDLEKLMNTLEGHFPTDPRAFRRRWALYVGIGILIIVVAAVLLKRPQVAQGRAVLETPRGRIVATNHGSCREETDIRVLNLDKFEKGEVHRIFVEVQNLQEHPISVIEHQVVSLIDGQKLKGYEYKPSELTAIQPGQQLTLTIAHEFPLSGRELEHVKKFDSGGYGATQAVVIMTSEGQMKPIAVTGISSPCL